MNQDGFLPKSIQSTVLTFVSNLCLLPWDGEPWCQNWRGFLGSCSMLPGEGIKANLEEKQMLGPFLSQCWRENLFCKNVVLSFNTSHDRGLRDVLCWKYDGCLSVCYKTFWAALNFTAVLIFALIKTAPLPTNLSTVALIFLVFYHHMIICHIAFEVFSFSTDLSFLVCPTVFSTAAPLAVNHTSKGTVFMAWKHCSLFSGNQTLAVL